MNYNRELKNEYYNDPNENAYNEDELEEIDDLQNDEINNKLEQDKYFDPTTSINNEKIKDLMSKINDNLEADKHESHEQYNEENNKRKRGIPKTLLQNQEKYMEALKKQQMMKKGKSGKKNKDIKISKKINSIKPNSVNIENTRRLIVAGKVKYFPINENSEVPAITHNNIRIMDKKISTIIEDNTVQDNEIENTNNQINFMKENVKNDINKKIPLKYAERIGKSVKKQMNKNKISKKIPGRYAEQIEKDVKKQTIKNIRDFKDLRRIKAIENVSVDSDFDPNRASIKELRKLRIEQRNNEQEKAKKKLETNRRESAVQEILKNDKMSKFAKTVAIKNLSAGSRNKKYRDKLLHNESN